MIVLCGKVNTPAAKKTPTCNSKIIIVSEYKFSYMKLLISHAPEDVYLYSAYFQNEEISLQKNL